MKTRQILLLLVGGATAALTGCVAVPAGPNGQYAYYPLTALPPVQAQGDARVMPGAPPAALAQMPVVLQARMYPANERASQSGVLSGTVTNTALGKGRFQLNYRGETLTGEATRVDGDAHRGLASAYGPSGTFMRCEYQMQSARQGVGTCTLSDGAKYQVHIGG